MKILIINAIVSTAETAQIPKVSSIEDTMIYNQCLAFVKAGHEVTLYAAEPYKPVTDDEKGGTTNAPISKRTSLILLSAARFFLLELCMRIVYKKKILLSGMKLPSIGK